MSRPDYSKRLDDIEVHGVAYDFVDVDIWIGEQGIGPYEFWGQRGIDRQIGIDELIITDCKLTPDQEDPPKDPIKWLDRHQRELEEHLEDFLDCIRRPYNED